MREVISHLKFGQSKTKSNTKKILSPLKINFCWKAIHPIYGNEYKGKLIKVAISHIQTEYNNGTILGWVNGQNVIMWEDTQCTQVK